MADSWDAAIVGGVVVLAVGLGYIRRARERRAALRWFSCRAKFGGTLFEWRADLETLALTLAEAEAKEMQVAVSALQLRQNPVRWRMQVTGEPSVELTQVIDRARLAELPEPGEPRGWYEVPHEVSLQLEEQYQRFVAKRGRAARPEG